MRTADGEELARRAVVLATGAWSGAARGCPSEARPPVRPVKGQILELRRRAGRAGAVRADRRLRARLPGAARRRPPDRRRDGRGARLRHRRSPPAGSTSCCARPTGCFPMSPRWSWSRRSPGCGPGTPDNLPLVGPGALEGLVLATGHYRNGILLAPLTAEAVAGAARRRTPSRHPASRGDEDRAERRAPASCADGRDASPTRSRERAPSAERARRRRRRSTARSCRARRVGRDAARARAAGSRSSRRSRAARERRWELGRARLELAADRRHRRLPLAGADGAGPASPRAPRSSPSPCAASTPTPRARCST